MSRPRTTLTTEDGITMDIAVCLRKGMFRPGCAWKGSMSWTSSRSGRTIAEISYAVDMRDSEHGTLWVEYTVTDRDGDKRAQKATIALVTTQPNYGGRRWWFLCPMSGRRVRCLHLAAGSRTFASRRALGLKYRSQGEGDADRFLRAAFRLNDKLGGGSLIGTPPKPKWMRWRTYWTLIDRRAEADYQALRAAMASL